MTYYYGFDARHKNNNTIATGETFYYVLSFGIPETGEITDTHILEASFLGEDIDDDGARVVRLYTDNGHGLPATCIAAFPADGLLLSHAVDTPAEALRVAGLHRIAGTVDTSGHSDHSAHSDRAEGSGCPGVLSGLFEFDVPTGRVLELADPGDAPEGEPVREIPKTPLSDLPSLAADGDGEARPSEAGAGEGAVDAAEEMPYELRPDYDIEADAEAYAEHRRGPKFRAWLPQGVIPFPGTVPVLAAEPDEFNQSYQADERDQPDLFEELAEVEAEQEQQVSTVQATYDGDEEPVDPFGMRLVGRSPAGEVESTDVTGSADLSADLSAGVWADIHVDRSDRRADPAGEC